jgi:hypothetical protein
MGRTKHVPSIGEERNVYKIFIGIPEKKKRYHLGSLSPTWEDIINILKPTG